MNKSDLVEHVAREMGQSKNVVEVMLNKTLERIVSTLAAGEEVSIAGFGNFSVKNRAARQGRNPRTGEPIHIPASRAVGFKPAKAVRDSMNA